MRTTLVSVPWQPLELPSLALGILRARLRPARSADEVRELHAGIGWAGYLLEHSGGALDPADHTEPAEAGLHHGLGDRVFAGVLPDDPDRAPRRCARTPATAGWTCARASDPGTERRCRRGRRCC